MSGPIQTVNFIPPAQIQALTQQVTPTGIVTPSVISTGAVSALGDVTSGLISMRALQDSIYNLQAAVNPSIASAGAMNTQSFFGANTVPTQFYRAAVDDYASTHIYEQGGLSSENIQYLQFDSNANIPSSLQNSVKPCFYQNVTGTYIFGSSNNSLYFTGSVGGYVGTTQGLNRNRLTRREQFNLLQDMGQITGAYANGYTGFVSAWNSGLIQVSDTWSQGQTTYTESNLVAAQADSLHIWGNYSLIWRYNTSTKTVIARSCINMTKELWGTGSNNWKTASDSYPFVSSLGNDLFVVPIINPSTYGLLVFDVNLNPITIMQASAFAGPLSGVPGIDPLNYNTQAGFFRVFDLQTDQVRGSLVKRWGLSQLGTGTYTNLSNGQKVDVFSGNPNGQATFIYVSSSSQAGYNASDRMSIGNQGGALSPLSNAKWDNSQGKIIAWALCTGAAIGPNGATGTIASSNGMQLVPVAIYKATPDNYVANDTLKLDSFTYDPLTSQYNPLTILYPCVDIRDTMVYATGTFRSNTGTWFGTEGFKQTTFQTGSNKTGATSGIQTFAISVCCMTGSDTSSAYKPYAALTSTLTFPRNKKHWEDLYGQYYYQYTDTTGTYFQQNYLMDGIIQLSDINVKFYVAGGSLPVPQYNDVITGKTYIQQVDGTYKDSTSAVDPSPNASMRQVILNNGFAVRYVFAQYALRYGPTGSGNVNNGALPTSTASTTTMNPIPPPISCQTKNACPTIIFGDFDMPDGTILDSNEIYASQEFDLNYQDWSTYTGALGGTSATYNMNYSLTGTYDANNIKNVFNFAQLGLTSNVVNVRLPGESYTGTGNGKTGTVSAGKVVFEVKGEVFNGQPMKMRFSTDCANNAILSAYQATQLNYFGGGCYGNTSLWQDPNGDSHIFVGHGNGYYSPFSENWEAGNYVARQVIADLKTTGALASIISPTTLHILGLDNVQSTPGPSLRTSYSKVNDAIYNANGKYIFECSQKGLQWFKSSLLAMVRGTYSGNPTGNTVVNQVSGDESTVTSDNVGGSYISTLWRRNAYNELPILTGQQFIEAWSYVEYLFSYTNRYLSNRRRCYLTSTCAMINARTLELEQIIRGRTQIAGSQHNHYSRDDPGTFEAFLIDNSCWNEDEVEGVPTCGSTYMASKGKQNVKMWKIQDCLTKKTTLVSNNSNGQTRPKFAVSYDGSLGGQPAIGSTGAELPYVTSYGSICNFLELYTNVANLGGSLCYGGKQNGKDCFIHGVIGSNFSSQGNNIPGYPFINLTNTSKLNIMQQYKKGIIPKTTTDGKVITFAQHKTNDYSMYFNVASITNPFSTKQMSCFTSNENFTNIKNIWTNVASFPGHPDISSVTGPSGAVNWSNLSVNRSTLEYSKSWAPLVNSSPLIVNDLLIQPHGATIYFYRIDTGECVAQMLANDFDWDEISLPDYSNSTNQTVFGAEEHGIGAPAYMNGQFYILGGSTTRANRGSVGRNISNFNLKYNTPLSMNLGTLFATGTSTVVFTPQDALSQNNGMFCLLTTFKTTDYYNTRKGEYISVDSNYDNLYLSGVTAIGIYIPSDINLATYQAPSLDISTKFVNGGSWYARTGISFTTLLNAGYIKFMYAGQIPYKCRAQSPFIVSDDQIEENVLSRRQKRLLQEYFRAKNGTTAPYPDNGCYVENNTTFINTLKYKPYYDWLAPTDPTKAVIYNQSLGYTDVGTGRPLPTPL